MMSRAGCRITAVRRETASLPPAFDAIATDYLTEPGLDALGGIKADAVLVTPVPADMTDVGYRLGYVDLIERLADRGHLAADTRGVMVSSTRVYAEASGGWVTEDSPLNQTEAKSLAIQAAEQSLLAASPQMRVLRASGLYGRETGMLLGRVQRGQASADPDRFSNRIHRDDLSACIAQILSGQLVFSEAESIVTASDDDPATIGEVESWLADLLQVELTESAPTGPGRGHRRCDNSRLKAGGYRFRYPSYREGYRAVLGVAERT